NGRSYVADAMKDLGAKSAFTLRDLLVTIAVIAILALMLRPPDGGPREAGKINCANNLKQIDESFVAWSQTHDGKLPMQVSTNKGGTLEFVPSGSACVHFLAPGNSGLKLDLPDIETYLKDSIGPKSLICPSDERSDWPFKKSNSDVAETNVSYFVGI